RFDVISKFFVRILNVQGCRHLQNDVRSKSKTAQSGRLRMAIGTIADTPGKGVGDGWWKMDEWTPIPYPTLVRCSFSSFRNRLVSRFRNRPTSVTTPTDSTEPRSLSLVTTAGLISTHTRRTPAGVMLPTPMEWSIEESIRIRSAPLSNRPYSS